MNEGKKVSLFTRIVQIDDTGSKNEIEFFVEGNYTEKGENRYITYKETEISGMDGTTTTIRIGEDALSIIRFGTYNSKLEFKRGEQTLTNYQTPYGNIPITIDTQLLDFDLHAEGKSNIHLKYNMESGCEQELRNEVYISYK